MVELVALVALDGVVLGFSFPWVGLWEFFQCWNNDFTLEAPTHPVCQNLRYNTSVLQSAGHGFDDSVSEGAVAAPTKGERLFYLLRARNSFMVDRVGALARVRRFLLPVRQPHTARRPHLTMEATGLQSVQKEPTHG